MYFRMIRIPGFIFLLFMCALAKQDSNLHKFLIDKFKQSAMDSAPHSLGTTIVMRLSLRNLQAMEHEHGTTQGKFYVEEEYSWNTGQQMWDPREYAAVHSVKLPAANVWTPDVILDNPYSFSPRDTVRSALHVHSDGLITWKDLRAVTVPCFNNPKYTITCVFQYRIFSFDSSEYDLHAPKSDAIDTMSYTPANTHKIEQTNARRYEIYKPCCIETFPKLVFNVTMMPHYK